MKRTYIKLRMILRGESLARARRRIRRELWQLGYESAWLNVFEIEGNVK